MTATADVVVDDPDRWRARSREGRAVAYWAEVAPDRPAVIPTVSAHDSDARTYAELNARAGARQQVPRFLEAHACGLRRAGGETQQEERQPSAAQGCDSHR